MFEVVKVTWRYSVIVIVVQAYLGTWESLDDRATPRWYDEDKFGIMIHFGVYSATIGSEWFWMDWKRKMPEIERFLNMTRPPGFTYQDFANEFKAELFDPYEWVDIFKSAGAKYIVITAKHHDGFVLHNSSFSPNWNSVDLGPHINFIQELSEVVRGNTKMKFGIYYSLMEWFHPLYLKDKAENTQKFVDNKIFPELTEIVEKFSPDLIWADGDWEKDDGYWRSRDFLAWLFTNSSVKDSVVVNDRWGRNVLCKHGSYVTCKDRFNPGTLQSKKFENILSLDKKSWGFDPTTELEDILSIEEIVRELVTTVACNGNLLLNVGPKSQGRIENIYVERLLQLGKWLKINGEGVFGSKPWIMQNEGEDLWFTIKENFEQQERFLYTFVLKYPYANNTVSLRNVDKSLNSTSKVFLLGYREALETSCDGEKFIIKFPEKRFLDEAGLSVAWTLKTQILF